MTPQDVQAKAAALLQPISDAKPGGDNASYDPDYDAIRSEVGKLDSPTGGEVDWSGPSRFADVRTFVAVPVRVHEQVVGAVIVSRTPREQVQAIVQMAPRLVTGLLVMVLLTVAIAVASGHRGSRSLRRLARAALAIARGAPQAPELHALRTSRVHEVAALAGAVDTMRAQLQARLRYIDEFAGNVAHEFRTPIATLRGTFELLHDDPGMPAAQRERFVSNALAELTRLDALVGGLLALARAERPAAPERVDLQALVEDLCAERPGVRVEGRCGWVEGCAEQLEAVVLNLVDNALQHGGAVTPVIVRGWATATETGLQVIDHGPGIAPGHRDKIFDRFFTTDRHHGIGLGLAMVRLVCQAHGGEVTVRSRPGHTVFSVALPAAAAET
ncbi:MAG: HAMP domain-containing protein, partial [Myxococcales bacterium]|nr:HAMP domain-containing protein [Myxococcales bacterium]